MISRYTKRTYDSADIDYNALASDLRLDVNTGFLLQKYGVNYQNAAEFFAYDAGGLRDPFLMHGMKQAAEIVNSVIKNGEAILIYGDYDADGISAAALLKLYFDSIKAKSSVYLPKRSDGYGLKIETLSKLAAQRNFDLLLTVDCGITAVNEVEFVKKILKRKVVVTDHHEASEKIPDCICVNPKLGYPFRDLSGSGVALKLVQALSDEKTYRVVLTEYLALGGDKFLMLQKAAENAPDLSPRKGVAEVQAVIDYIKETAAKNGGRLPAITGGRISGLKKATLDPNKK